MNNASSTPQALRDQVAIVTGASRGLGAAIAQRLAAAGAKVIINYARSEKEAHQVAASIHDAGGEALVVQADLSQEEQIAELFSRTLTSFQRLDILVNNAGVYVACKVEELNTPAYEQVFNLNVRGLMLASAAAARHFRSKPGSGGRIINLSSIAADGATKGASLYAASKAAIEAMTRIHAAELGDLGVTVNAVAPGPVMTDMLARGLSADFIQQSIPLTPLGRLGVPEDIADVVAWLASDQARWITGQVIRASGGLRR